MKKTLFILLSPLAYLVYLWIYFYKAFFKAGHALRCDWKHEFCEGDRHPSNRGPVFIGPNDDVNQKKRHRRGHRGGKKHRKYYHHGS